MSDFAISMNYRVPRFVLAGLVTAGLAGGMLASEARADSMPPKVDKQAAQAQYYVYTQPVNTGRTFIILGDKPPEPPKTEWIFAPTQNGYFRKTDDGFKWHKSTPDSWYNDTAGNILFRYKHESKSVFELQVGADGNNYLTPKKDTRIIDTYIGNDGNKYLIPRDESQQYDAFIGGDGNTYLIKKKDEPKPPSFVFLGTNAYGVPVFDPVQPPAPAAPAVAPGTPIFNPAAPAVAPVAAPVVAPAVAPVSPPAGPAAAPGAGPTGTGFTGNRASAATIIRGPFRPAP